MSEMKPPQEDRVRIKYASQALTFPAALAAAFGEGIGERGEGRMGEPVLSPGCCS
jgi:hypothetical protein